MSGTNLGLDGTALENNLAQLLEFLADLGMERFDFSTFTEENRKDLMNLYSVSLARDPLIAVAELYTES